MPLMGFDIAIAPLIEDDFNRCKSAIKWMEYSISESPGIYSNVTAYKDVVKDQKTGLLVDNDTQSWLKALEEMISNDDLRNSIQKNAYDEVIRRHSISECIDEYKDLYKKLMSLPFNTSTLNITLGHYDGEKEST